MKQHCSERTVVNELLLMVVQETGASEVGMANFCHKKDGTKLTLILLVPVKLLTALVQLKEFKTQLPIAQPAFTCSKLTIETLEQGVKYAQS